MRPSIATGGLKGGTVPQRPDPGPMDPARFQQLVDLKQQQPVVVPEPEIDPFRVPVESTGFALELLVEAGQRRLVGGELLCLFEEASLHNLGAAALGAMRARSHRKTVSFTSAGVEFLEGSLEEIEAHLAGGRENNTGGRALGLRAGKIHDLAKSVPTAPVMVAQRLHEAGLGLLDGCDTLVLNDRVLRCLEPGGPGAADRISVLEDAQSAGLAVRAGMTVGHVESYLERVENLLRVRDSQDRTGGYRAFVLSPFTASDLAAVESGEIRERIRAHGYTGATDFLRTLAITRIALDNVPVIEADWMSLGRAVGQLSLFYGADDLGCAGPQTGSMPPLTENDLEEMIAGAGFRAVRRDSVYDLLD